MLIDPYRFGAAQTWPFFSVGSVQVYEAFNLLSVASGNDLLPYPYIKCGLSVWSE